MKTYRFKASVSNLLMSHLMPHFQKKSALFGELSSCEKEFYSELAQSAREANLTYRNITTHSCHYLTTPANRSKGCEARVFASMALLIMHVLGRKKCPKMSDLLDGDPSCWKDLLEELPLLAEVRIRQTTATNLSQELSDPHRGLTIRPTYFDKEFTWIAKAQHNVYKNYAVDAKKYREWFTANPTGFFIFYLDGQIIGHLTLLPFKEESFLPYQQGIINETDLGGADIWSAEERKEADLLYVESYMVSNPYESLITPLIRQNFLEMAGEVVDLENVKGIYAMGATPEGRNTIGKMGFTSVEGLNGGKADGTTMNVATVDTIRRKLSNDDIRLKRDSQSWAFIRKMDKTREDARDHSGIHPDVRRTLDHLIASLVAGASNRSATRSEAEIGIDSLNRLLSVYLGKDFNLRSYKVIRCYLDSLPL